MQTLEILIEDNTSGMVRPVDVLADAPVATIVQGLVKALGLPQTDLFGKRLVYMLRRSMNGQIIPERMTLIAADIQDGMRLTLDSFVLDGTVAALEELSSQRVYTHNVRSEFSNNVTFPVDYTTLPVAQADIMPVGTSADPTFYSSVTMGGVEPLWEVEGKNTTGVHLPAQKKSGNVTRRAILLALGATLGVGGVGIGYSAYHRFMNGTATQTLAKHTAVSPHKAAVKVQALPQPVKAALPTMIKPALTFTQHKQAVRVVTWSPSGAMLLSGADDAHVFVWKVDGTVIRDIVHPTAVRALAWSPDGQRFVSGAGNQVAFFQAGSGMNLKSSRQAHTQMVTSLAWASHGKMQVVSGSDDKHAVVWDGQNYQAILTYAQHTAPILAASWAADGQSIATSSQGGFIRVWSAVNGRDLHGYYQDAATPMQAAAFAPVGMLLAVGGDDGIVRLWNGFTCGNAGNKCADVPQRLQASNKAIRSLAWSSDGRLLAVGADDGMLTVWAPGKGQGMVLKQALNAKVHSLAWSPDGKQLVAAAGNTVTLWNVS